MPAYILRYFFPVVIFAQALSVKAQPADSGVIDYNHLLFIRNHVGHFLGINFLQGRIHNTSGVGNFETSSAGGGNVGFEYFINANDHFAFTLGYNTGWMGIGLEGTLPAQNLGTSYDIDIHQNINSIFGALSIGLHPRTRLRNHLFFANAGIDFNLIVPLPPERVIVEDDGVHWIAFYTEIAIPPGIQRTFFLGGGYGFILPSLHYLSIELRAHFGGNSIQYGRYRVYDRHYYSLGVGDIFSRASNFEIRLNLNLTKGQKLRKRSEKELRKQEGNFF